MAEPKKIIIDTDPGIGMLSSFARPNGSLLQKSQI